MTLTPEQFTYWLEGFIQTAPGITDQARQAIQAKVDELRKAPAGPLIVNHRPGFLPIGNMPRGAGDETCWGGVGAAIRPVFVEQAEREAHFPHFADGGLVPSIKPVLFGERP